MFGGHLRNWRRSKRMSPVVDIQRRFMELGRIRAGDKGPKGEPRRGTTWRLTSASRSLLDAGAKIYGGDERACKITTLLNVMLPRIPGLGVWRLESHGWNAATVLPGTLEVLMMAA